MLNLQFEDHSEYNQIIKAYMCERIQQYLEAQDSTFIDAMPLYAMFGIEPRGKEQQ